MRFGAALLATSVFALPLLTGCGQSVSTTPTIIPAKGKITHKGQALTKGRVVFEPTGSGKEAYGDIKPDGTFTLTTYKDSDGAVPGTHRVFVDIPGKNTVPAKYFQASSSKIEIDVIDGTADYPVNLP